MVENSCSTYVATEVRKCGEFLRIPPKVFWPRFEGGGIENIFNLEIRGPQT